MNIQADVTTRGRRDGHMMGVVPSRPGGGDPPFVGPAISTITRDRGHMDALLLFSEQTLPTVKRMADPPPPLGSDPGQVGQEATPCPMATSQPATSLPDEGRTIESVELFQGSRKVVIIHEGKEYILRITQKEKLILTK